MTSNIELKEQPARPTLSIRITTRMDELPKHIGECYMKIVGYMAEIGEKPEDVPFTAFHNLDMQNLDVEMGFPLKKKLPGKGEILAGKLPQGLLVSCLYKGPNSGMEPNYNELFQWISDHQYESTGVYYEYYYNSLEEVPESELLTRIDLPVTKK